MESVIRELKGKRNKGKKQDIVKKGKWKQVIKGLSKRDRVRTGTGKL